MKRIRAAMELSPASRPSRIDLVDILRGIAIAAMVVYHFSWDLSFYGFVPWDVDSDPGWRWFARLIAGSFLFLVGVSLELAHRKGIRWSPFFTRLAVLVVAAALVSVATYLTFPDAWIYFGILHCIAAASLIALPSVRAPLIVPIALSALFFALPFVVQFDVFDAPWLAWVGLGSLPPPPANDYEPIFPWVGCTFAGVAVARIALAVRPREAWSRFRARDGATRMIAWSGRQSLWIYLAHQPILFGLVGLVALGVPSQRAATDQERATFVAACVDRCTPLLGNRTSCRSICVCAADDIEEAGLWQRTVNQTLRPQDQDRIDQIVEACGLQIQGEPPNVSGRQ
ncbi:DUF1624 domain-containing protein [Amorphus sp. 3PC139-8]|uniref:DUF1624 domain-containing protein n=1 Tax=Amorphus sp. 3PC139-8 TaxID=2735676 RepID=UPI00345CB74C